MTSVKSFSRKLDPEVRTVESMGSARKDGKGGSRSGDRALEKLSLGPARIERKENHKSIETQASLVSQTSSGIENTTSQTSSGTENTTSQTSSGNENTTSQTSSGIENAAVTNLPKTTTENNTVHEVSGANHDDRKNIRGKNRRIRKVPQKQPASKREFTFTGYDIMADVGTEIRPEHITCNIYKLTGRHGVDIYIQSCRRLQTVPVSQIIRDILTKSIKCCSHQLGAVGTKALAVSLVNNDFVQELDIADNGIEAEGVRAVADLCSVNTNITTLNLSHNGLTSHGMEGLCRVIRDSKTMRSLNLSGNRLQDDAKDAICDLIENNISLKEVCLSHNGFGEASGVALARAIYYNDTIEDLDLSWNHLREKGAVAIGKSLQHNSGIKNLNLGWNGFNREGGMALAASLRRNYCLVNLDLTNNRLTPGAVNEIITALLTNTDSSLAVLKLGLNPITPEVAKRIIAVIKEKMTPECALKELDLGNTVVDKAFVESLSDLSDKDICIVYGPVIHMSHDMVRVVDRMYHDMDPVEAMFGYMQEKGMRVVDLMKELDSDKNNYVDRSEFIVGLKRMGFPLTRQQLDDLMLTLDKDKDGVVDLREFLAERPRTLLGTNTGHVDKKKVAEAAAASTI